MGITIVSAGKGEGKTTFLCESAARLAALGRTVGGIASPAVFEDDRRVGYDLLDLRAGNRRRLAQVAKSSTATNTVGMYRLGDAAVTEGNISIISAVRDRLDVVILDEVGPLEFRGGGWAPALEVALRECSPGQELIIVVRPSLVDELPKRFPSDMWASAERISPPWPASLWR